MAGFEESGLAGKDSIRKGLQDASEPKDFISTFQQENRVLLSSLHPALHLLDLQSVKRASFHQSLITDLSKQLLKRINDGHLCNEQKLKELLDHTIQFIHVDTLRPIIMGTLTMLTEIKPEIIDLISSNNKIYQDCPIEVKRCVWTKKHPLFGDAVGPILNKYIEEKQTLLYTTENIKLRNFFSIPPRQRRQKPIVKQLVEMIGNSIELYNLVLQFLRTLFLRTKEEHYCTLRSELLMAFHDADVKEVRQVDPCHKFTWCLDACIRDKSIDTRRLKELQTFLDGIKKGQEEVMGDIAMIMCDPYATNTIVISILQLMNRIIKLDVLPRSSADLMFLIRILTLSLSAWGMIKAQNFKEEALNIEIITKFLPLLMVGMIECTSSNIPEIPEDLWTCTKESPVALLVVSYYVNQLIQTNKTTQVLEVLLPKFAETLKSHPPNSTVANVFVHTLLRNQDSWFEKHFTLVFDRFLLVWAHHEDTLHHSLRLLHTVYTQLESSGLVRILTASQPAAQHSDAVHDLHAKLVDLVASTSKVSTPSEQNSVSPVTSPKVLSPGVPAA